MIDERALDARIEELENRVGAYEDRHEIEMVMGHYILRDNPRNMKKNLEFFALDKEDVSVEWGDMGRFTGAKKVREFLEKQADMLVYEGQYRTRWLTTPMIEVAKDRQTAKAVWMAPGAEAGVEADGTAHQLWNFVRFAVDFIKMDGHWKFWHFRMFQDVRCDFEKGWVRDNYKWIFHGKQIGADSAEPTYVNPYNRAAVQEAIPACPCPYESWTDESWVFGSESLFGKRKNRNV